LDGELVEIFGLKGLIEPEGEDSGRGGFGGKIDANGRGGRCLYWIENKQRWMVHLFDAMHVAVPEENLRELASRPAEQGGFDLVWPSAPEGFDNLSVEISNKLQEKGYCCIQMIAGEEMREAAMEQATLHSKHKVLREEFVTDYLGRSGSGKTAFWETEIPDGPLDRLKTDAVSVFDRSLTNLASAVAPFTWELFGFPFGDRTKGMLWQPYANSSEEDSLRPKPINDQDIDEGAVADHIGFLQRRKLCFMMWLENQGGEITLIPRPDLDREPVTLPLSTKKILVYRADEMAFEYKPEGRSVVLQTWLLAEKPRTELSLQNLQGDAEAKAEAMGIYVGRPHPQGDKVHVMAIHDRLPGSGIGSDGYWAMLGQGTDGMSGIPFTRWDTDLYCTKPDEPVVMGKCYAWHGGFCSYEEIYHFDNKFFGISDTEATFMSPGQRVMCEDGYAVLFKGGHTRASLDNAYIGVFLGDTGSDWFPFNLTDHKVPDAQGNVTNVQSVSQYGLTGGNQSITCSRLSHLMNMRGPVATADTACSSSLVATGAGMNWMRPREFDDKLKHIESRCIETVVGGVCVQIGPMSYIGMCALSMISPNGRCFTFDESGDGYARGEGVGLMYLKSSEDEKDRVEQCACLLSAQINQDGRSASMTAPNGPSQQACIQASMKEAGNQARDLALAECHGTGTALGDPIEVGALRNAMEPRDTVLALTSSKSNIGHLEGGAGIAGLLKCILMLNAGVCPPNAHCRQLNPHLAVSGFPCYFDTEAIDTMMNSALTGVSSFGFGGTNGRCDIWGQAKFGPRGCGKIDLEEIDQILVTCPITMAPIDHITGEPMMQPMGGQREKYRADVLRDEFAPYDVSRFAYTGGFRYRRKEVPEDMEVALPHGSGLFVCGSWSGYKHMEELERQDDGWYLATMVLGEGRYELFDICLDQNPAMKIYPAVHKASRRIWVNGPDAQSEGQKWLVDGRDREVAAGTVFNIRFRWTTERMEVDWEPASMVSGGLAVKYAHTYSIVGDFTKWRCQALEKVPDEDGAWKGSIRIGNQGRSEFQFVRDDDMEQAIYPSQPRATSSSVPCRGPDDLGRGKHFLVKGHPGETQEVKVLIDDAKVWVTVTSERGTIRWASREGWKRHEYCVVGTFDSRRPIPMEMDSSTPGLFSCTIPVGETLYEGAYGELFQVTVDGDSSQAYYPEVGPVELPGQVLVRPPDGNASSNKFLIRAMEPNTDFDVFLDLNAEDRRKIVTWAPSKPPEPPALTDTN